MARVFNTNDSRTEAKDKAREYRMSRPPREAYKPPKKDLLKFPMSYIETPKPGDPLLLFMAPGDCVISDVIIRCDDITPEGFDMNLEVEGDVSAYNFNFNTNDSPADITVGRGDRLRLSVTGEVPITSLVWISFYYRAI